VTEWRGSGLQSRAHGFDSRHRVDFLFEDDVLVELEADAILD
jgi:hypothetical protein